MCDVGSVHDVVVQVATDQRMDTGQRSSSSSNPTLGSNSGEMYSNLGDLYVGGAFVGESQRRHSFTEEDELIVIRGNNARLISIMMCTYVQNRATPCHMHYAYGA